MKAQDRHAQGVRKATLPKVKKGCRLIGLTGTNGAGKGEAAAFFIKHGYAYFSLSDVIREKLVEGGFEPSRDNLIRTGNDLRKEGGPDILARLVMDKVRGKAVIDSIRNAAEIAYLKKHKGFILLAVDAPAALRFERVLKRGRDESARTLEEFIRKEKEERSRDAAAQQLDACLALADLAIRNEGSLEELHRQLEELL
jgi:dephospho-CoA kinase